MIKKQQAYKQYKAAAKKQKEMGTLALRMAQHRSVHRPHTLPRGKRGEELVENGDG